MRSSHQVIPPAEIEIIHNDQLIILNTFGVDIKAIFSKEHSENMRKT